MSLQNDLYSMLNELKVQSQRELNHLQSLRSDIEASIRTHFDNIRQKLPPGLLQMTLNDLSNKGGSIVWMPHMVQLMVKVANPKQKNAVLQSTFLDAAVKPSFTSFSVIGSDSDTEPQLKFRKKSPSFSNQKVITDMKRPIRELTNISNTVNRRASLRSTARNKLLKQSRVKGHPSTTNVHVKLNSKAARKVVPGEEIFTFYCSKTGTPLLGVE